MISPFPKAFAGSGNICLPMNSYSSLKSMIPSPNCAVSPPRSRHISFTGSICSSPLLSCTISRGAIFPAAALEIILSRSPMFERCSCIWSIAPELATKLSTVECLFSISAKSLRGIVSQLRSILAPRGDEHLSITSSNDTPSFPAVELKTSRLRKVKRSIHTKLPLSMRESEHKCATPVFWFCSR